MRSPDGKGYPVPDPIDPRDLVCFRVYVPAHTWYIGAFWQAYEYFTTWSAWMRDPLKKGKVAAQVWRAAFDKARAEFDRTKGACVMAIIDIRSKPLNPCVIQFQTDDMVWHDGPDMSCCGGGSGGSGCGDPLRQGADGSIERYNPTTGTWSSTTPGMVGADNDGVPAAYPDDPQARCLAGANYVKYTLDFLESLLTAASTASEYGEWAAAAAATLLNAFGNPLPILTQLFAFAAFTLSEQPTVIADRLAQRDNVDMLCEYVNSYSPDGKMSADNVAKLRAALQAKADATSDDNLKWWYQHSADLVAIWKTEGADNGARAAGVTEADCSDCGWVAELDFTKQLWGYQRITKDFYGNYNGKRTDAVGIETTCTSPDACKAQYQITVQEITVSKIETYWTPLAVTGGAEGAVEVSGSDNQIWVFGDGNMGIERYFSNLHGGSFTEMNIFLNAGAENTPQAGTDTHLRLMRVHASGPIPPAWADAIIPGAV